jgi:hypothetical protein
MELPMRRIAIAAAFLLIVPAAKAADDELELAFNDHCRECHSFVKDDNRLVSRFRSSPGVDARL